MTLAGWAIAIFLADVALLWALRIIVGHEEELRAAAHRRRYRRAQKQAERNARKRREER